MEDSHRANIHRIPLLLCSALWEIHTDWWLKNGNIKHMKHFHLQVNMKALKKLSCVIIVGVMPQFSVYLTVRY